MLHDDFEKPQASMFLFLGALGFLFTTFAPFGRNEDTGQMSLDGSLGRERIAYIAYFSSLRRRGNSSSKA